MAELFNFTKAKLTKIKGKNPTEKNTIPVTDLFNEMTFRSFFDKYINDYAKHTINNWKYAISAMDRQVEHFYDIKMSNITRDVIQEAFNKITVQIGEHTANRFVRSMDSIFNKAIEWGWEGKNPASRIKKHKVKLRDRYLLSEEIPRFFKALEEEKNELIKDFILMTLYTGARKSNVLSMAWNNISFEDKAWYIANAKNPLADEAMEILERRKKETTGEWVFPSKNSQTGHLLEPKKVWDRILQRADIKDFRIHDLRRTMSSWITRTGTIQCWWRIQA